jgi:tRNA A-37 threonylcarbamoyl transferase component Bud32
MTEPFDTTPEQEWPICPACQKRHAVVAPCETVPPAAKPAPAAVAAPEQPAVAPRTGDLPAFPPRPSTGSDPMVGRMVGSFKITRPIGRGGMGTVYLAEHPAIGSKVAIKFLHEAMASNTVVVGRFYEEARVVNLIGHEHIVAIFDLSLLPPNRYFIVMEYLDGETLGALIQSGPVEPRLGVAILLQLCDALQAVHARGVVHRDLKPDNVFLVKRQGRDHFVKLVDFGIAKLRDAPGGSSHTAAGMLVGTPEYMAPEQCDNQPVDARTDIYALGVIAYELATGRLPFSGKSITQLLLAHLQEKPKPPREFAPSVNPILEMAILRALEKRPEDRFQDMAALGAVLKEALAAMSAPQAAVSAPPAPEPADDPFVAALLEGLQLRMKASYYELLELPLDADFAAVRARASALRRDLESLRLRPLKAEQAMLLVPLLHRIDTAAAVLGVPSERLAYDAGRGNYLGVTRCIASGIPDAVLASRRAAFMAEHGGKDEEAQRHLARAQVARALHNEPVALAEYEAALAQDPLNLSLHQAYWGLRRQLAGKGTRG